MKSLELKKNLELVCEGIKIITDEVILLNKELANYIKKSNYYLNLKSSSSKDVGLEYVSKADAIETMIKDIYISKTYNDLKKARTALILQIKRSEK